ncbi:MAG: orotidine-5'-phosphate decarboxylase [Gammaproteobacteria bacterium]|nr:orotidine-5'-phosphate decarboxylase [Gammaproteobacteria bacterium]
MISDPKVIVALDTSDSAQALEFAQKASPELCKLKVGKELFTSSGPQLVEKLTVQGYDIFLDLKFHDIPNTVKKAVFAASQLGIWMINVHASGGQAMLLAAREAVDMAGSHRPFLIAVTVLTSMSDDDMSQLGINRTVSEQVRAMASLALESGLDGMVCSAKEAAMLRQQFGDSALLVTPGIRPVGTNPDDQQRIMTPKQAINDGSSYLVIGRPITQHANPAEALAEINQSLIQSSI